MEQTKTTIYDVARKLGVSTTTVNRVLNNKPNVSEKTRKAVMEAVREMNYRPSKTASSLSRSSVHINMLVATTIFDFDKEVRRGAEDAYRELFDFNLRGEVITLPITTTVEDFCAVVDQQAQQCDALAIIPPGSGVEFSEYLDEHYREASVRFCNGISQMESDVLLFSVACNGVVAGSMAAQLLEFMLQGRGKVAMFTGSFSTPIHKATCSGFTEYVEASSMDFCGIYEHKDNPELAEQQAELMFREHPDIDGIYIGTANSIPICRKLEELGAAPRIKIVASDIFELLSEEMDKGIVDATIFQNPYMVGKMMIQTMYEAIAEGKTLDTKEFLLDPQVVMNSNKLLYMK